MQLVRCDSFSSSLIKKIDKKKALLSNSLQVLFCAERVNSLENKGTVEGSEDAFINVNWNQASVLRTYNHIYNHKLLTQKILNV